MSEYSHKSRSNKKNTERKDSPVEADGELSISSEKEGYDPYNTLPGVPRKQLGMRRRKDGKWSF